jgi:hypothetical protein
MWLGWVVNGYEIFGKYRSRGVGEKYTHKFNRKHEDNRTRLRLGVGRSTKLKENLCEWGAVAVCCGHGRNTAKLISYVLMSRATASFCRRTPPYEIIKLHRFTLKLAMNVFFNSPVWHLNKLRVQLTNWESCHGWTRRLTRIGEWETNNYEEIKHNEKKGNVQNAGERTVVTKWRHVVKSGRGCGIYRMAQNCPDGLKFMTVTCYTTYGFQWWIVRIRWRGGGPIK